eukprot:gnl/Chilomastix_cuspidata/3860.p1 GENE.gnl/Chilomastix_cuspidata/3860~~gnl/Chilomastix_cuspidata/3860.p1  ORF type:complete len:433 (-),score=111.05 gnl/Chilomastix_cuspidata/3860:46-1344(-)
MIVNLRVLLSETALSPTERQTICSNFVDLFFEDPSERDFFSPNNFAVDTESFSVYLQSHFQPSPGLELKSERHESMSMVFFSLGAILFFVATGSEAPTDLLTEGTLMDVASMVHDEPIRAAIEMCWRNSRERPPTHEKLSRVLAGPQHSSTLMSSQSLEDAPGVGVIQKTGLWRAFCAAARAVRFDLTDEALCSAPVGADGVAAEFVRTLIEKVDRTTFLKRREFLPASTVLMRGNWLALSSIADKLLTLEAPDVPDARKPILDDFRTKYALGDTFCAHERDLDGVLMLFGARAFSSLGEACTFLELGPGGALVPFSQREWFSKWRFASLDLEHAFGTIAPAEGDTVVVFCFPVRAVLPVVEKTEQIDIEPTEEGFDAHLAMVERRGVDEFEFTPVGDQQHLSRDVFSEVSTFWKRGVPLFAFTLAPGRPAV